MRRSFTPGTDVRKELEAFGADSHGHRVGPDEAFCQLRVIGFLDSVRLAFPTTPELVTAAVERVLAGRKVPMLDGEIVVPGFDAELTLIPDGLRAAWAAEIATWAAAHWLACGGCDLLPDGWRWWDGEALVVAELPLELNDGPVGLVRPRELPWARRGLARIEQQAHGGWLAVFTPTPTGASEGPMRDLAGPLAKLARAVPRTTPYTGETAIWGAVTLPGVYDSPDEAAAAAWTFACDQLTPWLGAARAHQSVLEAP